uniref:Uncharacterized protein n=1 Tax=Romanomermis culicivorax TaxID=13658 RepID=A0A915JAH1_ROMCU
MTRIMPEVLAPWGVNVGSQANLRTNTSHEEIMTMRNESTIPGESWEIMHTFLKLYTDFSSYANKIKLLWTGQPEESAPATAGFWSILAVEPVLPPTTSLAEVWVNA